MDSSLHQHYVTPPQGNLFSKAPARVAIGNASPLGELSPYYKPSFSNESDRMTTLIEDSGFPERHLLPPEYSPRSPMSGREWNDQAMQASSPRTLMSGIFPDNSLESKFVQQQRHISPNQRRRQQRISELSSTTRQPGADLFSAAQANPKTTWRSRKAQRVGQNIVDSNRRQQIQSTSTTSKSSISQPNQPKQDTRITNNNKLACGPIQYNRARLEHEASVRIPSLRHSSGPRLATDTVPNIRAAGVTVVPSHVSTLGQSVKIVSFETRLRQAEPRMAEYNKSEFMTEVLGGEDALHTGNHCGKIHKMRIVKTEGMDGHWKPWSVCHSAPDWIIKQSGDKESILKKIVRDKRETEPVKYIGFTGHVNPWTVSAAGPEWIKGHMSKYDENSILSKEGNPRRARRQFEGSDNTLSSNMINALSGQSY